MTRLRYAREALARGATFASCAHMAHAQTQARPPRAASKRNTAPRSPSKRPPSKRAQAQSLRAEARLLTTAGLILLAFGFPLTLLLVAQALTPDAQVSAVLPFAAGAPPIVLGYLACHFASQRMVKAKALERRKAMAAAPRRG